MARLTFTQCHKCGKPVARTLIHWHQSWNLQPLTIPWPVILNINMLPIRRILGSWKAETFRSGTNHPLNQPTHHDRADYWLAEHHCDAPPYSSADPILETITPPPPPDTPPY